MGALYFIIGPNYKYEIRKEKPKFVLQLGGKWLQMLTSPYKSV